MISIGIWEESERCINSLVRLLNDEKTISNLNVPNPYTKNSARSFIKKSSNESNLQSLGKPNFIAYPIMLGTIIIGQISLTKDEKNSETAYLGIWIGSEYWGNGYAAKALQKFIDCKVNKTEYEEIYAGHSDCNEKTKKLLLKCGFKPANEDYSISFKGEERVLHKFILELNRVVV